MMVVRKSGRVIAGMGDKGKLGANRAEPPQEMANAVVGYGPETEKFRRPLVKRNSLAPRPRGKEDLQFKLVIAGAVFLLVFLAGYLIQTHPPRDQYGYLLGRDFVNTWMGARAVLAGQVDGLFHLVHYNQTIQTLFGKLPPLNWSYPPALLLFVWPFGFLPYIPALALWSLAGFTAYVAAASSFSRSVQHLGFVAVAPVVGICLFCGQNGFFTAALLILFFRYWDERPLLAGLFLGLMLYKPHLVVLFPLALALSGRWKVFASAAATALALVLLTALVFGHDIWSEYFRLVTPVQKGVMDTGTGFLTMMPTGFMHARMLGFSPSVARWVQLPFSFLALAALVWTFWKKRDPLLSGAVLITASFVVTPYAFDYDMVVFGWLLAMLWSQFETRWDRILFLLIWTLPITMLVFGAWYLPVAAPLMALFLLRLLQKQNGGNLVPAALHS